MKKATHFKYIEWRDTKGLHEDILDSLSELRFLRDELRFLKDLVAQKTLELIYGEYAEESQTVFSKLTGHIKKLERLLEALEDHNNKLQVLLDDDDVPGEVRNYKDAHYALILEVINFHAEVKKTKRTLFQMLSELIKKSKQKNLS